MKWIDTYSIRHWRIFRNSYRMLAWVGSEPTTTKFCSDALKDGAIRLWVQLALRTNFVQLLQFHVFVQCSRFIWNVVNNSYQQNSRVLYTFVSNKSFNQLSDISPENFIFLKIFDLEFLYIEVSFTYQNSNPLEIEDKVNITLGIN